MSIDLQPTYDTEQVRRILGLASAQDVRNLTRPGRPLFKALIRDGGPRGRYDVRRVRRLRGQMARRRLAEALGRSNPRYLGETHSRICPECGGLAVEWGGVVLCEDGHRSEEVQGETLE